VHHILPDDDEPPVINQWPILADYEIGGITASQSNSKMTVINNVVSGAWQVAFHFKPLKCDERPNPGNPDYDFYNNVAHSISGNGAVALNVANQCTEVRDFVAYKCTHSTIVLGGPSDINRGRNIVSIDNHWGIAIHSGNDGKAELIDSTIYGEDELNKDCPVGSVCDHCLSSTGVTLNQACSGSHLDSQKKWFKHPLWKQCTSGMRAEATYTRVLFKDFKSGTKACGAKMSTFAPWKAPDYVAFAEFKQATFEDTHPDAVTFMQSPSQGWVNWEDCGIDFTCTGLYNVVTRFE